MKPIAVIGDAMWDKYTYSTKRHNPENSSPCYTIVKEEFKHGGASNVNLNLEKLGSRTHYYHPAQVSIKQRIYCDNEYVCRIDDDKHNKAKDWLWEVDWSQYDYIVVSDYLKGALNKSLAKRIINSNKIVIVDTKPEHANWFKGAYLMKPNLKEFNEMQKKLYTDFTLVTLGADGMIMYYKDKQPLEHFKGIKVKAVDVTGAGDTVLATLAHFLNKKYCLREACVLANKAGALSVTHLGCYAVKEKELI